MAGSATTSLDVSDCPRCATMIRAMIDRASIEQAKGMVMQAHGVDGDEAFTMLRRRARTTNTHINELVADVLAGTVDARHVDRLPPLTYRPNRR